MIDDERVDRLIGTTLRTNPTNGSTHWSVRTVAALVSEPPDNALVIFVEKSQ